MQDPFGNEFCIVEELTPEQQAAAMASEATDDHALRVAAGQTRTYRCLFVSSRCSGAPLGAMVCPCLDAGLVVVLVLGPGSDLSEVPVYQGVSRPRWIQSRPWVSSRTQPLGQLIGRRLSARSRR